MNAKEIDRWFRNPSPEPMPPPLGPMPTDPFFGAVLSMKAEDLETWLASQPDHTRYRQKCIFLRDVI